jgi:hypothetical protein
MVRTGRSGRTRALYTAQGAVGNQPKPGEARTEIALGHVLENNPRDHVPNHDDTGDDYGRGDAPGATASRGWIKARIRASSSAVSCSKNL